MGDTLNERATHRRIVLCHLESLVCLPALNIIFADLGDEISLVVVSNRFGDRHGGVLRQLIRNVRRSGWRMTLWLGFDIISAQFVSAVAPWFARVIGRRPSLQSVRALAARHGAKIIETSDVNSLEAIKEAEAISPDLVVVMNFDQILRAEFIKVPTLGVINVHPSLLPSFRGPCPVFWALAEKRANTGATIHLIEDEQIDAGRILSSVKVPVEGSHSVAEITTNLFTVGARALAVVIDELRSGNADPAQQRLDEGQYRGFPSGHDVSSSRRLGVRLCNVRHIGTLVAAALGLAKWNNIN